MKVFVFVAVAIACVLAVEDERVKKDVFVGGFPFAGVRTVGYDDGKYYPGKYEHKAVVAAPAAVAPAVVPGVTPYAYNYGAYPYSYSYGAYPYGYNYGVNPYYGYNHAVKQVVY